MAGGGNFIHRVISYVVNELVVNSLANSEYLRAEVGKHFQVFDKDLHGASPRNKYCARACSICACFYLEISIRYCCTIFLEQAMCLSPAFQRFAVRTSKKIEDVAIKGTQMKEGVTELFKDLSKDMESYKKQ